MKPRFLPTENDADQPGIAPHPAQAELPKQQWEQDRATLSTLLRQLTPEKWNIKRHVGLYLAVTLTYALGSLFLLPLGGTSLVAAIVLPLVGFLAYTLWYSLSIQCSARKTSELIRQINEIVPRLAGRNELSLVGPLAEVVAEGAGGTSAMRSLAQAGLTHLLPLLKTSDAALLDDRQRACLYHELTLPWRFPQGNLDFLLAILKALEQVGDEKAVPYVERLARTAKQERLRTAARACLPFLTQRVTQEQVHRTLLRASEPASIPLDELVRPAGTNAEVAPAQLLRASGIE